MILSLLVVVLSTSAPAQDTWTLLCDFDQTTRLWGPEGTTSPLVRPTTDQAHTGRRSLAVTMIAINDRSIRQTWGTDVSDLRWSLDSEVRFWLKGSALAQRPHGGLIFVEAGGRPGGGNSHWMVELPGEIYSDPEWHLVQAGPLRNATNPEWAPDADGQPDPARIVSLLWVAQQEAPPELNRPFTFYMDDVEVSHVEQMPITEGKVGVEDSPDHVTPIWRGFRGRAREHPALVTFTDVTGWRVFQHGGARASLLRSEEEPCYEDLRYQAKVTYRSEDGSGYIELAPPQPIPISEPFNAACAWVHGNNWAWVPDPTTPPVNVWLRFSDATGQQHRVDLGVINFKFYGWLSKRLRDNPEGDPGHVFWGGAADGRIHLPAHLQAIEIHGGIQPEPRTIYLESVAVYQDDMPLPSFRPELIANLPFPTTPDTILPTVAQPTEVSVIREGDAFVFTATGDETVVWRYVPVTGTLSDLTVSVAGRPPITPCAGGGPTVWLGAAQRPPGDAAVSRKLLSAEIADGAVRTIWRFSVEGESTEISLQLRARGKSLVADWSSADQRVMALGLGRVEGLRSPRLVRVPYMCIHGDGPSVLLEGDTFLSVLLDWYNTESSGFYGGSHVDGDTAVINGGAVYNPLTDGTRNPLGERQFINVSSRFEEVLPNIPNPPSTQAAVTRTHLYSHLGGISPSRFDDWLVMWRRYHRKGIEKVMVTHHEDAWTNGADVGQGGQEYTMCIEAAPEVGDEKLIAYCRAMRELGYYVGLYENFTDYNPLGQSWDGRNLARNSYGETIRVWPPTYAIRPLKALEMALDYPRRVAAKFGTNTAYRDCHTAYPPWGQVDYQAGTPGAGKFATNFRAWGALLMDGSRAYGGPIFSEGGHHWFSAGLVDGNYAQIWMPGATEYPLLLDFDLLKLHPLEADISMTPGPGWGPAGLWSGLAATIAYGHIGFLPEADIPEAARYYYLIQQLQSRYVMIPAVEIRYHRDGQWYDISAALKAEALPSNQVRVRYASGLEVAVNYNVSERWTVDIGGRSYDLSPFGWAAADQDGFLEFCTEVDGRRIGLVDSPAYLFADGGGRWHDFGSIATDGAVVVRRDDPAGLKVIVLAPTTRLSLELPPGTHLEGYDEGDRPLGTLVPTREGHRATFDIPSNADYFRVVP